MLAQPDQGRYYSTIQEAFGGDGDYHGMVLGLQRRLSGGWSMNTNLTLSECDNNGEPGVDITNVFPDPNDPSTNRGPCDADRPYIFNSSFIYQSARRRQRLRARADRATGRSAPSSRRAAASPLTPPRPATCR